MKKVLFIISILVLRIVPGFAQSANFKIVGYYSLRAALKDPDTRSFKYLTHVNLAFLNPDSLGNFTTDLSSLKSFVDKAHKQNIKVLFSIGGGSKHPQYHWLLQPDQRTMFVQNLVSEVLKYNIDGVDVDLEGGDISEYYEAFVIELANALRSHQKWITAAVAIYYKNQFTDTVLNTYDFVNIMAYDRTGPWRPEKPGPHSTYTHAVEDLRYFGVERKIPKEKMTLGVPFYGYGYGPELSSKASSSSYDKIVDTYPGSEYVDEWLLPDGKIIYYNGIPTMKQKTKLANEYASGIMIWQVLGDAKGKKSLLRSIYKASSGK